MTFVTLSKTPNPVNKEPITISKALSFVTPYFGFAMVAWIVIVLGWYLIGLPLGPVSMPTL